MTPRSSNTLSSGVRLDGDVAAQLAAIVKSSHDAIISYDLDGLITSWNPGAERMYGFLPAEVLGVHSSLLIDAESQSSEAARLVRVAAGERVEMFGTTRVHKGGAVLAVSLSLAPIVNDDGLVIGIASASREVGDLALAQSRSRRLMDATLEAMMSVDSDGIITLISDQVELLFGYGRSDLIGQPVEMLIPTLEQAIHTALRQGYVANPAIRPMGGSQLSARRKDGTSFPADISLSTSDIGGSLIVTLAVGDVSDRVAVKGAKRDSEARARQLADSVDVAFLLRGLYPSALLYVSPGYEKIFGYNPVIGNEDPTISLSLIHPEDRERFGGDYRNPAQVGLAARAEYRIIRSDGEVRWVRAMTWPMADSDGKVNRAAATIEDITERRLAETALRSAHAQADKANAAKNEFLSRTSHELRTPLNAVLGFAQLLELDTLTLTADQQDSVGHILHGGRHLLGLIDDVLDIAMIESNRMDLSLEPVRISDIITETVNMMTPLADTSGVTMAHQPGSRTDLYVLADSRRLRQVLMNLLSNAIKYNRQGGRIDVHCEESADSLVSILVKDTGRGIRAMDLPRLFTPFDRLGAQATGIEGSGVGLALSNRLMAKMGGTLQASSEMGVGSTFTISIPVATLGSRSVVATRTAAAASSGTAVSGSPTKTMVYIEDNISNIQLMERLINRHPQWRLIVAEHAAFGLELAASSSPDLVLLDLHLPDMDGIDVLLQLRADPQTHDIPIVVISADANPRQINRLLAAGAHQYLTKPLVVAEVVELLNAVQLNPTKTSA